MASEIAVSNVVKRRRRKCKVIDVSYLDFKLKFVDHEFITTFVLEFDEVTERSNAVDVTKGWIRVTTERSPGGHRDFIYGHPKCDARLRSLKDVKEFINLEYDLVPSDVPGKDLEKCPGLQFYRLLDPTEFDIENKKNMRKMERKKKTAKGKRRNKNNLC